eukprot:m.94834 g.94834  ORF g.94834 m.94834 type:complete len:128 (-) comp12304_c0_seq2:95-478(-)
MISLRWRVAHRVAHFSTAPDIRPLLPPPPSGLALRARWTFKHEGDVANIMDAEFFMRAVTRPVLHHRIVERYRRIAERYEATFSSKSIRTKAEAAHVIAAAKLTPEEWLKTKEINAEDVGAISRALA